MLHNVRIPIPVSLFILATFVLSSISFSQESRHFTFHYAFTVKNLPAGKKVRIWIPAAQSDAYQDARIVSASGDLPLKRSREPRFGNEIYFAETEKPAKPELHFDVEYDVTRHERIALNAGAHLVNVALTANERQEDLEPNALVPTTGLPADLAVKGLPAASAYAAIAPSVPHALHMPSHIFAHIGMWHEMIESNRASYRAARNELSGETMWAPMTRARTPTSPNRSWTSAAWPHR